MYVYCRRYECGGRRLFQTCLWTVPMYVQKGVRYWTMGAQRWVVHRQGCMLAVDLVRDLSKGLGLSERRLGGNSGAKHNTDLCTNATAPRLPISFRPCLASRIWPELVTCAHTLPLSSVSSSECSPTPSDQIRWPPSLLRATLLFVLKGSEPSGARP